MPICCGSDRKLGHSICDIIGYIYSVETIFPYNVAVLNEVISNVDVLGGVVVNQMF